MEGSFEQARDGDNTAGAGVGAAPGEAGRDTADEHTVSLDLERLILDAPRRYTPYQAARAAGVPMELASRFWRAMGFPDIGQSKALTEQDVIALRRLAGLVESGLLSEPMAIQVARSTGQTTARLAEWQMDTFLDNLTQPVEPGMSRADVAYPLVELLLPELEQFLVYVWRRQLAAVTGRVVQAAEDTEVTSGRLAVGFADLVGFTRLGSQVEVGELSTMAGRLANLATSFTQAPVRLVKTIGDAAMFVSPEATPLVAVALRLVDAFEAEELPSLRAGIAFGPALLRAGDYYGNSVNLASRVTGVARPGSVLCTREIRDLAREDFTWSAAGRHKLKGVSGPTPLYRARHSGEEAVTP